MTIEHLEVEKLTPDLLAKVHLHERNSFRGRFTPQEVLRLIDFFGCKPLPQSETIVRACRGSYSSLIARNEIWWFYFTAPPGLITTKLW